MKAAQLLVRYLENEGVELLFGLPGRLPREHEAHRAAAEACVAGVRCGASGRLSRHPKACSLEPPSIHIAPLAGEANGELVKSRSHCRS